jgi:hypothetical protein
MLLENLVQSIGSIPSQVEAILCESMTKRSVELLVCVDHKDAQSSQLVLEILRFQSSLLAMYKDQYAQLLSLLYQTSRALPVEAIQQIIATLGSAKPEDVRRYIRSLY